MNPSLITNVYFENEADLSNFLVSDEQTAKELRYKLILSLKNGEGLVAVINGSSPRALVLRYTIEKQLTGKKDGDELFAIPFA